MKIFIFCLLVILNNSMVTAQTSSEILSFDENSHYTNFKQLRDSTYLFIKNTKDLDSKKSSRDLMIYTKNENEMKRFFDIKLLKEDETPDNEVFIYDYFIINDEKILVQYHELIINQTGESSNIIRKTLIYNYSEKSVKYVPELNTFFIIKQSSMNPEYFMYYRNMKDNNNNNLFIYNSDENTFSKFIIPDLLFEANLRNSGLQFGRNTNELLFGIKQGVDKYKYYFYNIHTSKIIEEFELPFFLNDYKISATGNYMIFYRYWTGIFIYNINTGESNTIFKSGIDVFSKTIHFQSWVRNSDSFLYISGNTLYSFNVGNY